MLGDDASLAPLKRLIAEKTEGNPLFMEEIVLGLLEDGALARNGEVKLAKPLDSLRIPPTYREFSLRVSIGCRLTRKNFCKRSR